jgi:hypothetical protein
MRLAYTLTLLACCLICGTLCAEEKGPEDPESSGWSIDHWKVQTSIYTKHFDPDPDHVNNQKLLGVEAVFENGWLAGAAVFDNSFGQDSQFVFMGKSWPILRSRYWYFKLIGGLLHGYKEPYEDKIPFNNLGIAPGIVPSLGVRYKRVFMEANLGGLAVVTVTAGFSF